MAGTLNPKPKTLNPVAGFRVLFSRGRERVAETILLFDVATPSLCAQEFSYRV